MVGLTGLEPATFGPPDRRATKLRHSPFADEATAYFRFFSRARTLMSIGDPRNP